MRSARLEKAIEISGRGLFSGVPCFAHIQPAESGLSLQRGEITVPIHPDYFIERAQCTVIGAPGTEVAVTEHLLAAMWAAGIDNAHIIVQGPEMPSQDGSALPLYEALLAGGRMELGERPELSSSIAPIELTDGASLLRWEFAHELSIEYEFRHSELGEQHVRFRRLTREAAASAILPARTFITASEAQAAIDAGLLRNSHEEDALLIRDGQPNSPLRFPDEFARHKVLDLLGDLYALPYELTGRITARLSGHKLNRALARELLAAMQRLG